MPRATSTMSTPSGVSAPDRQENIQAGARTTADNAMCRLLCIPEQRGGRRAEDQAHRLFSVSMALSGLRCLLSYIALPILLPALGIAAGVGPYVGIPVGIIALVFDVKGIRRFWIANHRWRWPISAIYAVVILMVLGLLIADIAYLAS
ncbi:MAG: hypothetical protein ACYCS4_01420 [Acidimicrobiales bacterium]